MAKRRSSESGRKSKKQRKSTTETISSAQKENANLNSSTENDANISESENQEKEIESTTHQETTNRNETTDHDDEHQAIEATLNELIQGTSSAAERRDDDEERAEPHTQKRVRKRNPNKRRAKRKRKSTRPTTDLNQDEETDQNEASSPVRQPRLELTELEKFTSKYPSFFKSIEAEKHESFCPYDRIRPALQLKGLITSHDLQEILKMYILITKDSRSCPYLLTKTGLLLLRKYLELRPEDEEELCKDVVDFVKYLKGSEAIPNAELFLDFFVFCYETGNEKLIEEFGELKHHVKKGVHLHIKQMRLCYNMFTSFMKFLDFFETFKADDPELYKTDELKSKDFTHVCILLQNLTVGNDSDEEYPLDQLFLCLIDLLILFKKLKKAKKLLLKYYQLYPDNLNAVIYLLKFNEIYLKDLDLFKEHYNKLIKLDPSNPKLIYYLDYITVPSECVKILLSYVDYKQNKDDLKIWKLIHDKLKIIARGSAEEADIKHFYSRIYASYWPTYHFSSLSIKISKENCDFIYHKAFVFYYFQPQLADKFIAQILVILTLAKSDKVIFLKHLISDR